VKAVLVANLELANGFPDDGTGAPAAWDGGNADWGNFVAAPKPGSTLTSKLTETSTGATPGSPGRSTCSSTPTSRSAPAA